MTVTLIAALDRHSLIGSSDGSIPWKLPRDQAHFRQYTKCGWLLLGRLTYAEMQGWFGDQQVIVLSRSPLPQTWDPRHQHATSVEEALDLARSAGCGELIVCGGAAVYTAFLPKAQRMVLTRIEEAFPVAKPVYFPAWEKREWVLTGQEKWQADRENPWPACLETWNRVESSTQPC